MKLTSPTDIRKELEQAGVQPSRQRGQNFLADANILNIVVESAELQPADRVIEVGPGLGTLTERLAEKAGKVIAVELDSKLFKYLEERFARQENVELIHSDILDLDLARLIPPFKVVANLPYSVASRAMVDLSCLADPPELIVATIQLEVAERLVATPGCGDYGLLSVFMQTVYAAEIRKIVSASCFWPRPRVQSAVVVMRRRADFAMDAPVRTLLHEVARRGFMRRRKQLAGTLDGMEGKHDVKAERVRRLLTDLGLTPEARPEELSPTQWRSLAERLVQGE